MVEWSPCFLLFMGKNSTDNDRIARFDVVKNLEEVMKGTLSALCRRILERSVMGIRFLSSVYARNTKDISV